MTAAARFLPDGRLHLQHGPMDLILQAWGDAARVQAAYDRAWSRFAPLLDELVAELQALRSPDDLPASGAVARAMTDVVRPFRPTFITPMAAVAGAVADEILGCLALPGISKAYVNNGGDISLHLTAGQSLTTAIAARPGLPDRVTVRHDDPVRGIATSGWRGRSFSRGIADAVTVLAPTAAMADAAATIIANAVDLPDHPAVTRRPANEIKADSDLGAIPVTTVVGPLTSAETAAALCAGEAAARNLLKRGLISGAALFLLGEVRCLTGAPATSPFHLFPNIPGIRGQRPRRIGPEGDETKNICHRTEAVHG